MTGSASPFFTPGPGGELYVLTRDSGYRNDIRERLEWWWQRYAPYCGDTHFLSDARTNFVQRTWELYLGALLLDHGYQLERPPPDGPDIKIVAEKAPIWIEAVAPQCGTGADEAKRLYSMKKETKHGFIRTYRLDKDKTVLRYTSALRDKHLQLQKFKKRGIVAANESVIIAISGASIQDADLHDEFPDILRAVYPIGETVLHVPIGEGIEPWTSATTRPEIVKAKGARVGTTAFLGEEKTDVSLILFSPNGVWNIDDLSGREIISVHNLYAEHGIDTGFFGIGREYWIDQSGTLRLQDHRQDRRLTASTLENPR